MSKINREEYEVLKGLDDKWKWIARDEDLEIYEAKPVKRNSEEYFWDIRTIMDEWSVLNSDLFRFIKSEDSEPYSIAELIAEYEKESEETEVKNIEWAKKEIENIRTLTFKVHEAAVRANNNHFIIKNNEQLALIDKILEILNQLDEPEVLSQEWIDEHAKAVAYDGMPDQTEVVYVDDLQNLLVPKQEDINKEKQEAYIKGFKTGEKQTVEFYEEHESKDFNKKVNQLIKAIENPKRIKLRDVIERMDALSEKNRNDWIERINERYEVEKEQKYEVILPAVTGAKDIYLVVDEDSSVYFESMDYIVRNGCLESEFTEKEIKAIDERYWAFAVKVEELEE